MSVHCIMGYLEASALVVWDRFALRHQVEQPVQRELPTVEMGSKQNLRSRQAVLLPPHNLAALLDLTFVVNEERVHSLCEDHGGKCQSSSN